MDPAFLMMILFLVLPVASVKISQRLTGPGWAKLILCVGLLLLASPVTCFGLVGVGQALHLVTPTSFLTRGHH